MSITMVDINTLNSEIKTIWQRMLVIEKQQGAARQKLDKEYQELLTAKREKMAARDSLKREFLGNRLKAEWKACQTGGNAVTVDTPALTEAEIEAAKQRMRARFDTAMQKPE